MYRLNDLSEMRRAGIDVTDFIGTADLFVCPVCDVGLDLLDVVKHVLDVHPLTGLAFEVRRILDEGGAA